MNVILCDNCKKEVSEQDRKHNNDQYKLDFAHNGVHIDVYIRPVFQVGYTSNNALKNRYADLCLRCRKDLLKRTFDSELPITGANIRDDVQQDDD